MTIYSVKVKRTREGNTTKAYMKAGDMAIEQFIGECVEAGIGFKVLKKLSTVSVVLIEASDETIVDKIYGLKSVQFITPSESFGVKT